MGWRGIFAVLAGLGAVILLAGAVGLPETLPTARRVAGGLTATLHRFGQLLRDGLFTGAALAAGLANASSFAYLAGATFVLQKIYGLSPQGYSFVFATISLGFFTMGHVGGRLARRWPAPRLLAAGLALNLAGATSLCVSVLGHLPLGALVASLFVMVSAVGLVRPPASALALAGYADQAGAASSLLGLCGYVCGAVAAPLVGIAGERTATPLGIVALSVSACAAVIFLAVVWPRARARHLDRSTAGSARAEDGPARLAGTGGLVAEGRRSAPDP
jgi:DHA1 family bicyclomycin/chloramphenicol resistance-like MFS transporter